MTIGGGRGDRKDASVLVALIKLPGGKWIVWHSAPLPPPGAGALPAGRPCLQAGGRHLVCSVLSTLWQHCLYVFSWEPCRHRGSLYPYAIIGPTDHELSDTHTHTQMAAQAAMHQHQAKGAMSLPPRSPLAVGLCQPPPAEAAAYSCIPPRPRVARVPKGR